MDTTTTFPVDWTEANSLTREWVEAHRACLRPSTHRWPAPNFLADYVIGRWDLPDGRHVELSEVTFRIGEVKRYIGVTFSEAPDTTTDATLVSTFDELNEALGL